MADATVPATAPASGRGAVRARRVPWSFLLALAVLAAALVVGSGVTSSKPPTDAQRASALEAQIRCPSCADLSVAQSAASSAIAVRHEVAALVAAGQSDQQIESRLVAQYGPSILLSPPASGLSSLVWFLPAAAGVLALGGVAVVFWRRSRSWRRLRNAHG